MEQQQVESQSLHSVAYSLRTNNQTDCEAFSMHGWNTTLYSTLLPIASGMRTHHKLTGTNRTNPAISVLRLVQGYQWLSLSP